MTTETNTAVAEPTADREIISTHVFESPRERVFQGWSNPDQLVQWWGPDGFTNTFQEFSFAPGGEWKFIMHGPDGKNYDNHIVFEEIAAPSRVVFQHVTSPRFQVTATFDDLGAQTKVTFRMLFETAKVCEAVKIYAVEANEQNFRRLEALIAKD
jgi:uncharacterized protein YndB with AHSA1/START domain